MHSDFVSWLVSLVLPFPPTSYSLLAARVILSKPTFLSLEHSNGSHLRMKGNVLAMHHMSLHDLSTSLPLNSPNSPPSTLPLSSCAPATQLPYYSWDTSRCALPWAFPCFSLPRKHFLLIPKWLISLPLVLKQWNEWHGLLENNPTWHLLVDTPYACPIQMLPSPPTPNLFCPHGPHFRERPSSMLHSFSLDTPHVQ